MQVTGLAARCDDCTGDQSPENHSEVLCGRYIGIEIAGIEIQVLMIKFSQYGIDRILEIDKVDDHSRIWIRLATHRHFQRVIMPVAVRESTQPECSCVLVVAPVSSPISMGGGKLELARQRDGTQIIPSKPAAV